MYNNYLMPVYSCRQNVNTTMRSGLTRVDCFKAFILKSIKTISPSVVKSCQCNEKYYKSIREHFGTLPAFQEFVEKR